MRGVTVELPTAAGWVRPVNEVSLRIGAGECVGLVGESGSGKTMLSLALMGLLPAGARVSGEVLLGGSEEGGSSASTQATGQGYRDKEVAPRSEGGASSSPTKGAGSSAQTVRAAKNLVGLGEEEWRRVRGREIAMIFQEPMTSLNPVMRIGAQIEEAILAHEPKIAAQLLHRRLMAALEQASVPEPEARAQQFPHQLSGGLRQRAMIAMALAARPKLLIADEPTTALDVTVQKQILELLDRLRRDMQLGLLFITHDLGVVARVADRVAVMYAGRIIEEGPTEEALRAPQHPYTKGLLMASPRLERGKLKPIPGSVPQLTALPPGCAFSPRCEFRREECDRAVPAFSPATGDHQARCVLL
jgi:oligopeptide/dipeptide ABC transporter ATP-binding protein